MNFQSPRLIMVLAQVLFLLAVSCTPGREAEGSTAPLFAEPSTLRVTRPVRSPRAEPDTPGPPANTFYVRLDGGTPDQCTGTANSPYPGVGSGQQPCAWSHPFHAFPPAGEARIAGGDTLFIGPGSYMMGYGAPGAGACESDYPWACTMSPVPSGSPDQPTRILGVGGDHGCANPPELWGTERADFVLNLTDTSHAEIACLEISDHASCVEEHSGDLACERETYPYGPWAATGLYAADSTNVILRDLNIHGLAHGGVLAGRLADWLVADVRIAGNGWVGWDGDIEGEDANAGTLTFRRWRVEWNGCAETYPEEKPAGCWGQSAGGYGDGLGTGETGGTWIIEESAFLHNTSDGLDLLYARQKDSQIFIRRTISAGNAGDQIKTTGLTEIENVIAVSNCGFFEGQAFTHHVDNCRSGGSAIALNPQPGNRLTVGNSTITGQGDCLVIAECAEVGSCSGSETITLRNNIFLGHAEFGRDDTTCLAWSGLDHDPFVYEHTVITGLKAMPEPCPPNSFCDVAPGIMNADLDAFDPRLLPSSPAIDAGSADGAPAVDFYGRARDSQPDIGAHEY